MQEKTKEADVLSTEERRPSDPQEYIVLIQIGGGGDKEIYRPGSRIMLDDARAAAHLLAGNVRAINATVEPRAPASDVVVHEAETAATRRAARAAAKEADKEAG